MQVQAYNFFLDGKWTRGVSTESFELRNPATAEVFGRVPRATRKDVNEVVEVARKAFQAQTPFGGYKDSGIGYEKGLQAIGHYTRIKSVTVNISWTEHLRDRGAWARLELRKQVRS